MENEAVPPSSPPHATTADTPDSPFFDSDDHDYNAKSSSPPPVFSSDDSRESADISNYESPRILKNKRKGGWWDNSEPASSPLVVKKAKMTRNFDRNFDSGIHMMSDASDGSEILPVQHKSPFGLDGSYSPVPVADDVPSTSLQSGPMNEQEHSFCSMLYAGLDHNSENYDFSFCNLQDEDIQRIGALASVIKNIPDPGDELPAEGQYRSLVPELYVNLRDNNLHYLTPSLFDVTTITSLVLTDNPIEELPAQISQLLNLKELNVSNTKLRWLPFELLRFFGRDGMLDIVGDSGVAWLEPKALQQSCSAHMERMQLSSEEVEEFQSNPASYYSFLLKRLYDFLGTAPDRGNFLWYMRKQEVSVKAQQMQAWDVELVFPHHPRIGNSGSKYLARTPVSYFDAVGAVLKGSPVTPSSNTEEFDIITETDRGAHGVPISLFSPPDVKHKHINPLATMAFHTALRHRHDEDLSIQGLRKRIGEPVPPAAEVLLTQAERNDGAGFGQFRQCHVCSRDYVIARADWIEWWVPRNYKALPFKIRVCSWACVPEGMRTKPAQELNWS